MQRIAALVLCGMLGTTNASAQGCDEVGDIVGGFAGAATGYGLLVQLGAASNWISAGLYGAGMAVASIAGNFVGETVCEDYETIAETTAAIYCMAGEYVCDFVDEVTLSLLRDFAVCPNCRPDEVFGAFFMIDPLREEYLRRIQRTRGQSPGISVLPRDHIVAPVSPSVLNSYFVGQQAGFQQRRMLRSVSGGL